MADVAVERVLGLGRGFPLVGPDDVPTGGLETEAEAADAREQLDDLAIAGVGADPRDQGCLPLGPRGEVTRL
jgi:hypothetical protein